MRRPVCQQTRRRRQTTSTSRSLPIQTCWPDDAGPLITWGLVITRGPQSVREPEARARTSASIDSRSSRSNQRDHALARASRRRARFPRSSRAFRARQVVPDRGRARRRSGDDARRGHARARLAVRVSVRRVCLRGGPTEVAVVHRLRRCRCPRARRSCSKGHIPVGVRQASTGTQRVRRPELAERGGYLHALEGPFGDHTGYYNERDWFPVFEIDRITHARRPDLSLDLHGQAARRAGRCSGSR